MPPRRLLSKRYRNEGYMSLATVIGGSVNVVGRFQ